MSIHVRNIVIGEGTTKICVPITGVTEEEIIQQADSMHTVPADLAEWRVDFFQEVTQIERVIQTLKRVRTHLKEIPLLFTFRTKKEGGEKEFTIEDYIALNKAAMQSGYIDLIDLELFCGTDVIKPLLLFAKAQNCYVILSNHDFKQTPPKEELLFRLEQMKQLGAHIIKIAVMPQKEKDVLTLLEATAEMKEKYMDQPIISMSMGKLGMISRLAGMTFGSAVTFGCTKRVSAPGQIEVTKLKQILSILS